SRVSPRARLARSQETGWCKCVTEGPAATEIKEATKKGLEVIPGLFGLLLILVGVRGFEPPTTCTPCRCATRLRYTPKAARAGRASYRSGPVAGTLFLEQLQNLFELDAQLPDDLLALGRVLPGAVARQLLASTGNGEALVVKQAADLADDDDVMPLVVTPVATALYRLELGKLLLPVTQNVRLDAAQLGNFPDREILLARNGG